MDALGLNWSECQQQSKADPQQSKADPLFLVNCKLDRLLATPCELSLEMTPEERDLAIARMFRRSMATHAFVSGQIGPEDLEECWFETGIDPRTFIIPGIEE